MKISYFENAPKESGVGYRAYHLKRVLKQMPEIELSDIAFDPAEMPFKPWPGLLGAKSVNWVRWGKRLRWEKADVYDITNQTLSFLAKQFQPAVVTVHDIIEAIEPQDIKASLLNTYLYSGIRKAKHIVAVSHYTKKAIVDHYGIAESDITVIPNAVGSEFHPLDHFEQTIEYQQLKRQYKIPEDAHIVLYVGSEHPRKNMPVALRAFAQLHKVLPNTVFVKVGGPGLAFGRAKTLEEIDLLGIKDAVRFIRDVSYEDLNSFYNIADVLVFPSRMEGFGLPPLQAMAAGLPVVCSNSTSLPEVAGAAALMHEPEDVRGFAQSLEEILTDSKRKDDLISRGANQAKQFSWEHSATELVKIYKSIAK